MSICLQFPFSISAVAMLLHYITTVRQFQLLCRQLIENPVSARCGSDWKNDDEIIILTRICLNCDVNFSQTVLPKNYFLKVIYFSSFFFFASIVGKNVVVAVIPL